MIESVLLSLEIVGCPKEKLIVSYSCVNKVHTRDIDNRSVMDDYMTYCKGDMTMDTNKPLYRLLCLKTVSLHLECGKGLFYVLRVMSCNVGQRL